MDKYSKTSVFTLMRRTSFTPAVLLFPPLANEVFFFLVCFFPFFVFQRTVTVKEIQLGSDLNN